MRFLLLVFWLVYVLFGFAQQQDLNKNYTPLKSIGPLPVEFRQNVRDVVSNDIISLSTEKSKSNSAKKDFFTLSNYEIDRILRSGNVLVNDEVTNYINLIADGLLKDNKSLREKLHLFALKSAVVNAYSYDKGYIFIDLGLIAQMESEAQLAYVMCHEISHYTKQHHINGYVLSDEIDGSKYDRENRLLEKCQYNREHESEADLEGFKLYERSSYDLQQAEKGFTVLQYSHLPFELLEIKKDFFETEHYKLPAEYFLKDFNPIIDNSAEDDSKLTHPNTNKRRQAINKLVKERDNNNRVKETLGQQRFEYIRDLCRMELCRLYLKTRDYPNAFYASYILLQKYPQNQYVIEVLSKAMYGICRYKKGDIRYNSDSYMANGLNKASKIESYPQQIYKLIEDMSAHEWAIMSLNKVYRFHKQNPDNKKLQAISDSLFVLLDQTHWTGKFAKNFAPKAVNDDSLKPKPIGGKSKSEIIEQLREKNDVTATDTNYYSKAFVDLFVNDEEFRQRFPETHSDQLGAQYSFVNGNQYSKNEDAELGNEAAIDSLLVLEPFYVKINQREKEAYRFIDSDKKQEEFMQLIIDCALKLGITLTVLDPGELGANDAEKMNDLSSIKDWFNERFDSELKTKEVLCIDNIDAFIKKYKTNYVLKTGLVNVVSKSGKNKTYFFAYVFDLSKNQMIYAKTEVFFRKDKQDLLHSKTYQVLFDLQHPQYQRN